MVCVLELCFSCINVMYLVLEQNLVQKFYLLLAY